MIDDNFIRLDHERLRELCDIHEKTILERDNTIGKLEAEFEQTAEQYRRAITSWAMKCQELREEIRNLRFDSKDLELYAIGFALRIHRMYGLMYQSDWTRKLRSKFGTEEAVIQWMRKREWELWRDR